jgi:hypothetical protein
MYVIVRLALSASPADNSRFAVGFVRKTRELKSACVLWVAEKLVRYRETPYRQRSRQSPTYSFANAQKEHISPIYVPCKLMAEADGSGFALCRIGNAASWPLIDDGYTISGGQTEWLGIDERDHAIRSQRLATLPPL